jgi:glycosyltransferase involved in cell wall biosynthesis
MSAAETHTNRTAVGFAQNPTVSFIVPCYNLGHLLTDCITSILSQTFEDFEILVMDDCSPDNTAAVANSFGDPRVIHVRNEPNLGHLRNYNKGIGLARGRYIWLVSADDYLRRPYVLRRYVDLMDRQPHVGYSFCAGAGVLDGEETGVLDFSQFEKRDRVVPGHVLLRKLLVRNFVLAAAGMVRRECYDKLGAFPLDMPWAGDWYLWCLFALHYDVAYFAEPMVCYRQHGLSMTNQLTATKPAACCEEEIAIPWDIKRRADAAGFRNVSRNCLRAVALIYARHTASKRFGVPHPIVSLDEFEESLQRNTASEDERNFVRAHAFADMASRYYLQGDTASAKRFYEAAFKLNAWAPGVIVKRALLSLGAAGHLLRTMIRLVALRS